MQPARDINTPFTGVPFGGNSLSRVSEFNFTARQSRATLLAETTIGSAKVSGYYEGDFLGAGTTSNNRQSNSYVFRQRQLFAQVAFSSGLSITGGQMWSMATENKKGIQNRQEALPMQIDPQYIVGFTWQRAYGFRVVQSLFDNKLAVGYRGRRSADHCWRPRLQHLHQRDSGDLAELLHQRSRRGRRSCTTRSTLPVTP